MSPERYWTASARSYIACIITPTPYLMPDRGATNLTCKIPTAVNPARMAKSSHNNLNKSIKQAVRKSDTRVKNGLQTISAHPK